MVSTVKSRPNHYELLGLSPAAKHDEIARAFAKGLSEPRPFGSLAEVTVAYETLRDPAKRKAYDSSLGLGQEPKPALSLAGRLEAGQFMGAKPASRFAPSPATSVKVGSFPRPDVRPQPRSAPSATALLRQPAASSVGEAEPGPVPQAEEFPRPEPVVQRRFDPPSRDDRAFRPVDRQPFPDARGSSIPWKLPAIAAGALVLAIGVGAWTGWEAGNDSDSVTVEVPTAKPLPRTVKLATATATASNVAVTSPEPQTPRAAPAVRTARARPPLQITLPEKQEAEVTLLEQKQRELETEQAAVESAAAPETAAKLPLPDAVIARTIARIGYPCGQVASAAAVDGAPGVFTVTCTSGHSYRASPVRGRYHFKRLASR